MSPFWTAQLIGWGMYVLVNHVLAIGSLSDPSLAGHAVHLGQKLIKGGIGLAMSLVLDAIYRGIWHRQWSLWRLAVVAAVASTALGWAWFVLTRLSYRQSPFGLERESLPYHLALLAWSALWLTVSYRRELEVETERALRATALASEAQLRMLRYQVNPHFLFNALNSIRALIDEQPARARKMVTRLAELFRYSLLDTGGARVPLGEELQAIRSYLAIQKIRFEERLEVSLQISAAAEAVLLPSFLIHPLVENAVKYGLDTSDLPLRVTVRAEVEHGRLRVEVSNSGRLVSPAEHAASVLPRGTGTGLANIRERLRQAYPGDHHLDLREHDRRVIATLEVPA